MSTQYVLKWRRRRDYDWVQLTLPRTLTEEEARALAVGIASKFKKAELWKEEEITRNEKIELEEE